jgi:hypothetical protein
MSRRQWIATTIAAIAALVTVVVIVTSGNDSTSATPIPQGIDAATLAQFRTCMSKHGAAVPQAGTPPQAQAPSAKTQRALKACAQYMPQGAGVGAPGGVAPPGVPVAPPSSG